MPQFGPNPARGGAGEGLSQAQVDARVRAISPARVYTAKLVIGKSGDAENLRAARRLDLGPLDDWHLSWVVVRVTAPADWKTILGETDDRKVPIYTMHNYLYNIDTPTEFWTTTYADRVANWQGSDGETAVWQEPLHSTANAWGALLQHLYAPLRITGSTGDAGRRVYSEIDVSDDEMAALVGHEADLRVAITHVDT